MESDIDAPGLPSALDSEVVPVRIQIAQPMKVRRWPK
jgi:hypothetical protein